jgi:hypothetical protein
MHAHNRICEQRVRATPANTLVCNSAALCGAVLAMQSLIGAQTNSMGLSSGAQCESLGSYAEQGGHEFFKTQ